MTHEMTAQVMVANPQITAVVTGSQGYVLESSARQASPPSPTGTTTVATRIAGTPNKAETMMVWRGRDGTSAARMAIIIAMPANCSIVTKPSTIMVPSSLTIE